MKCLKCDADIYEGVKKCPYCKTLTPNAVADDKFGNFDFKYTITSDEQVRKIHETIKETEKEKKKNFLVKFVEARRAKKRAARRAARRSLREQKTQEANAVVNETVETKAPVKVKKVPRPRKKITFKQVDTKNFGMLGKRIGALAACALVLVVLVWTVVSLAGALASGDDVAASYTYAKDNSLYMVYKGKNLNISENVVDDSYIRSLDENGELVSAERVAKNAGIVHTTKDGKTTFFFEKYDPDTNSGNLSVIHNGKIRKIKKISDAVHNSIVMTPDGEKLLYLQSADKNGDMGVLYYWEKGIDEPFKIATDIDHGTFGFAGDGEWAMFLQNLNRLEMRGDLYAKSLAKLKDEKIKLDTDVCKIFGMSQDEESYLYGKSFDTDDSSFDIYAINTKSRIIRLGERTKKAPVMQKKKNNIYVYGLADDGTNNLYNVSVNSGEKEKIATGVHSILMISKDEKTVIFDKVYSGKLADYYAYAKGKQPQKIAGNVVVDYEVVAGKPQMSATTDCRQIVYISEFEAFKGGGKLMYTKYKNGRVVSEMEVAENVYSCYYGEDGKFIFTKDYSPSRKVFDVYLFDGKEATLLKEEVSPALFGVSKSGDSIYYISNYDVEGLFGTLERMDLEGVATELQTNVFEFDLSSIEDVLAYKNLNTEDGSFDMGLVKNGKTNWIEINTSVDEVITY